MMAAHGGPPASSSEVNEPFESTPAVVKLCVLGPAGCGKTLLCRTLADQSCNGDYSPTAGVRIQVLSRLVGEAAVQVQLWDVAGDPQYQPVRSVLAADVDGVVLVIDPAQPEQERDLEQLYVRFAQPHNLTMKQCAVLAVSADAAMAEGWPGLHGKLSKLQSCRVCVGSSQQQQHSRQAALELLDKLLAGCVVHKRDRLEQAVLMGT